MMIGMTIRKIVVVSMAIMVEDFSVATEMVTTIMTIKGVINAMTGLRKNRIPIKIAIRMVIAIGLQEETGITDPIAMTEVRMDTIEMMGIAITIKTIAEGTGATTREEVIKTKVVDSATEDKTTNIVREEPTITEEGTITIITTMIEAAHSEATVANTSTLIEIIITITITMGEVIEIEMKTIKGETTTKQMIITNLLSRVKEKQDKFMRRIRETQNETKTKQKSNQNQPLKNSNQQHKLK